MDCDIRLLTNVDDDPAGFSALVEVSRADYAQRNPGDPLPGPAEIAAEVFITAPDRRGLVLAALVGDEAVGALSTATESEPGDENQVSSIEVVIKSEFQRQGVATALLAEALPRLIADGQTSILGYPCADFATDAAVGLAAKLGLTPRQEERCSRALVANIDDDLMATWIADAVESADGYRIEQWHGLCPPALAEQWSRARVAMEDQPLDGLDLNLYTRNVEQQRQADQARLDSGFVMYRTLALAPDGRAAGMSEIWVHQERPQIGFQGDTGVMAAHRGHGIGRWLKAANYQLVRRHHPELAIIETYNAQSNPWMLAINVAMAFRPHHIYTGYQGPIGPALAALGRS